MLACAGQSACVESPPDACVEKMMDVLRERKFVAMSQLLDSADALAVASEENDFGFEYYLDILNRVACWGALEFNS